MVVNNENKVEQRRIRPGQEVKAEIAKSGTT